MCALRNSGAQCYVLSDPGRAWELTLPTLRGIKEESRPVTVSGVVKALKNLMHLSLGKPLINQRFRASQGHKHLRQFHLLHFEADKRNFLNEFLALFKSSNMLLDLS